LSIRSNTNNYLQSKGPICEKITAIGIGEAETEKHYMPLD